MHASFWNSVLIVAVAASYARTETQHGKGHAYPEKVERDYGEPCVFPEKGG